MIELLDHLILGFNVAITPTNLMYCALGCLIGTIVGILPGLGPVATISMLLPTTYVLGPTTSIIMLAGIYYGAQYGGSTTSILLNTPGEASSVMTCIDGNKMAHQGRAGPAILVAGMSSFIAGCLTIILVAGFSPILSELAFKIGPAEYCGLMLLGFFSVSLLTTGDIVKGIGVTILGILIGCIGTDVNSGLTRFTFGWLDLADGVGFATISVGMFGLAEIVKNITDEEEYKLHTGKISLIPTWTDIKRLIPSSLRGTAIGSFFGLIPGGGAAISSYAAYAFDKKVSKYKDEFGHGAVEGVAAPEAANNAAAQTGFIPLLSLGIPENVVMALMLGALILSGVQPGPGIIAKQPELFWGLTASMFIGNLILLIMNVPLVRVWVQLIRVPYHLLYPVIVAVCCIGLYSISNNPNDILIAVFFAMLGYIFVVLDLSPAPMMLGLILGPMLEEYFRRQMMLSRGSFMPFIDRPISLAILCIISTIIVAGIVKIIRSK